MPWKPEARILGFDDGPFTPEDDDVDVVGVIVRAQSGYVEGILHDRITRDGDDATQVLVRMTTQARAYPNIVAVMTQNSIMAGFNTIDVPALAEATDRPVLAVSRGEQDWDSIQAALTGGGIPGGEAKWNRLAHSVRAGFQHHGVTVVPAGVPEEDARSLVDLATVRGHLPEPLRLAHLIAAGWVLGQSKGQ